MNKKAKMASITALIAVLLIFSIAVFAAPKKCNNGLDDDNDGLVDYRNDPGCSSASDNTETSSSLVCDNGVDQTNDRDTLADYRLSGGDPGCTSATDSSEIDGVCDDINDDAADADSLGDASDPGCISFGDPSEIDGQCDDLSDNDGDTFTDYPNDPGCTSFSDLSELGTVECDDGIDNDNDTFIDYPDDADCTDPNDTTEGAPAPTQCNDGLDNDGDGHKDYGGVNGDSKCSSPSDNSENPKDSCSETDGGISFTLKGTTSGDNEDVPYSFTDVCLDAAILREFYCTGIAEDYAPLNTTHNCTGNMTGCSDGACV